MAEERYGEKRGKNIMEKAKSMQNLLDLGQKSMAVTGDMTVISVMSQQQE